MKGRLQPGKMLLVDTVAGPHRLRRRDQARARLAPALRRMARARTRSRSTSCPSRRACMAPTTPPSSAASAPSATPMKTSALLMAPMAANGEEPIGSMGTDTPLACLSDKPQPLFNYFKQLFAQVTNPPIDPIREEMVMSLDQLHRHASATSSTRRPSTATRSSCRIRSSPIAIWKNCAASPPATFSPPRCPRSSAWKTAPSGLERALDGLCRRASLAIESGYTLLILSDRGVDRRLRAHPQPARPHRRPQSPGPRGDPHPGRAHHRIRRAARGDALRAAHRLRRQRRQSVSGHRNPRRLVHARPSARRRHLRESRSTTTSRPSTRACSKSSRRWASPRCKAIAARRCSKPSA